MILRFGRNKIIGIFAEQYCEMVVVAQLVEPWIVVPVVAGSSPVFHPYSKEPCCLMYGKALLIYNVAPLGIY